MEDFSQYIKEIAAWYFVQQFPFRFLHGRKGHFDGFLGVLGKADALFGKMRGEHWFGFV
jgi:hypothetical protein